MLVRLHEGWYIAIDPIAIDPIMVSATMSTFRAELLDELSQEDIDHLAFAKYRDSQIGHSEGDTGSWFNQLDKEMHQWLITAGVGQRGNRKDIINMIVPTEGEIVRTMYSCDYTGYCKVFHDLPIAYESYMRENKVTQATRLTEQLSKEEAQRITAEINIYWNEFVKEHHIDPTANPIKNILKCSIGTYVSANGKNAFDAAKLAIATWLFDYQGDQTPESAPVPKTHQGIWQDDFKQHQKFFGMLTPLCSQYAIVDEKDIHRVYEHAHGVISMNEIKTKDAEQAVQVCAVWLAANIISIADGKLRIKALFDAANVAPAVGEFKVITGYDDYARARIGGMAHDTIEAKVEAYLHASLEDAPQSHQNADSPISDVIPHRDLISDAPAGALTVEQPYIDHYMDRVLSINPLFEAPFVVIIQLYTPTGACRPFTLRSMTAEGLAKQEDDLLRTHLKRGLSELPPERHAAPSLPQSASVPAPQSAGLPAYTPNAPAAPSAPLGGGQYQGQTGTFHILEIQRFVDGDKTSWRFFKNVGDPTHAVKINRAPDAQNLLGKKASIDPLAMEAGRRYSVVLDVDWINAKPAEAPGSFYKNITDIRRIE